MKIYLSGKIENSMPHCTCVITSWNLTKTTYRSKREKKEKKVTTSSTQYGGQMKKSLLNRWPVKTPGSTLKLNRDFCTRIYDNIKWINSEISVAQRMGNPEYVWLCQFLVKAKPNIDQNLWVFAKDAYGLWVIADLWVMGHDFPQTNLVDKIFYGIWGVMGYQRYGLRGVRL